MKRPELPMEGACRCGRIHIRIDALPIMTAACHCTGCQSMSGSAFSLTAMIPGTAFTVTRGEPVVGGLRSPGLDHMFCPECMTWMFTRITGVDAFVNLRPTMLADASWFEPFIDTFVSEKLPWAATPARHQFDGFPPTEDYAPLMQEFAGLWEDGDAPGQAQHH
ncbi:GFA family protein [Paracoccus caeni]|uniref:GFA family protein n=1 Tax=Paracoccus caeni TaxID=657651 RepID=A0A934SDM3_9RHOB|nr:GFA family protein [Paracoccus caeni]MBK4215952.1 GFA family protein [Paracoccus caeni]